MAAGEGSAGIMRARRVDVTKYDSKTSDSARLNPGTARHAGSEGRNLESKIDDFQFEIGHWEVDTNVARVRDRYPGRAGIP